MPKPPDPILNATVIDHIDVRLSYKILDLFSNGLYASPNKAIEELVANSFDAGAKQVSVFMPADFNAQDSQIAVLDDGESMDVAGLKQHWMIGKSAKRSVGPTPQNRNPIGKFGIGKLATYVLANELTHVCKRGGRYLLSSMDYRIADDRGGEEVESKTPIRIALKELTESNAKAFLSRWTASERFKATKMNLFGKDSSPSWTFAILSNLKEKVNELEPGRLSWVLRTALPLRPDFTIHLDGRKLVSSKATKGFEKKWTLGVDILQLQRPAPLELQTHEDIEEAIDSERRFGFLHPSLGRVSGYAEAYEQPLDTGKSEQFGRSWGFFVFVRDRLINVEDGHFGIQPDVLKHGVFKKMRVVVNIDKLDAVLKSDREHVKDGALLLDARNMLQAVFNFVRSFIEKRDGSAPDDNPLGRKLGDTPHALSRGPVLEMVRSILDGEVRSNYIIVPELESQEDAAELLAKLESRISDPKSFVSGVNWMFDANSDKGIALYEAESGVLFINGLHPFVGAFYDEFISKKAGLPLDIFAMAEVLLESHLFSSGVSQQQFDYVMNARDMLFRQVAQESGKRTPLAISQALREARNNKNQLEIEMVAAFNCLGLEASRLGQKKKPDGIAHAHLSADLRGNAQRYSITLESKSTEKDGKRVSAGTVDTGAIARHRDDFNCDHAIVIASSFSTDHGDQSALSQQIEADRRRTAAEGMPRTITLIHIEDLARLVRIAHVKGLTLSMLRELFSTCSLPVQCKAWVEKIEKAKPKRQPFKKIILAIHAQQQLFKHEPVQYGALRTELMHSKPPVSYSTDNELREICKAMASMAPEFLSATPTFVALDQSPENVIKAIDSAIEMPIDDQE